MHDLLRPVLDTSLVHRFHEIARRHAASPAVRFEGRDHSYAELQERMLRLAGRIRVRTAGEPGAVVLLFPPGFESVVATLAVLEARAWYVPLDPSLDPASLRARIVQAEGVLVIAPAAGREAAREAAGSGVPVIAAEPETGEPVDPPLATPPRPDDLAYVYFTSGTTGPPKGVMDTHRNVLHNVLRYTRTLGYGPGDRLTLLQANPFSGAVSNVFGALLNGATLLPYDVAREGAGGALARWMERERPTSFHAVPSLFRGVCAAGGRHPDVRVVRLEGDAGAPPDVERFRATFAPHAVLAHGLGATETGLSSQFRMRADEPFAGDVLPIGTDTEDVEVVVVDEGGAEVPAGTLGEIVVRSPFLSPGYWRDPERTAAVFRDTPGRPGVREYRSGDLGRRNAAGQLEHHGRRNAQVKVRGLWLDLAAVEARLRELPGVRDAAAAVARDPNGEATVHAYLMMDEAARLTRAELRRALAARLPEHAVPSWAHRVEAWPLGPNGKLDRAALRPALGRPLAESDAIEEPRDDTERGLVEIWSRVLGIQRVGIRDSFLDRGGDSLRAVEVSLAIESRFGVTVPHGVLAEAGTIAALAERIARARAPGAGTIPADDPLVWLRREGAGPAVIGIPDLESGPLAFSSLARALPGRPVAALRYPAAVPLARVPDSIADLAATFAQRLERVPGPPPTLVGFCFGGVVALEVARRLAGDRDAGSRLVLANVTPYDLGALVSPRARKRFRWRWGARLAYLAAKPDAPAWIARRVARMIGDLAGRIRLGAARVASSRTATASAELIRARLREAFHGHRPAPHAGDVALVLARETLALYADDPHEAWRGLARGHVEIRMLPRDGYAMLEEPDVRELAGLILGR